MSLWRALRSAIGSYRSFSQWRVSGRRKEQRRGLECTLLSKTVCKSDASIDEATEAQRKDRSSCSFFNCTVPRVQLSARICDDQDKSNFVSAAQAWKSAPIFSLEILLSSCLRYFFPTSFSRKDSSLEVRIEKERGIKDETPGCSFHFWSEPHREIHGSCRFDTRELVWPR